MARIRADYVFGTLDAALTASGTTLSSPTLSRLPAVTGGDVAAVTLHDSATGTYEIVHVTAHAASATTATIARGREGSTAQAWASGASWLHGPTASDLSSTGLLGSTTYNPATEVEYPPSSKTVLTDVDAANIAVTFAAPPSGTVTVVASFAAVFEYTSGVYFGLREGTTDLPNTRARGAYGASGLQMTFTLQWVVTGLAPGSSHTYKLSHQGYGVATSPVSRAMVGGQYGPLTMTVRG